MADKQRISAKQFKKNVILSVAVQLISLCVSLLLGLVVPKYISEYSYAYWQGFVLYLGYVGVLHFGLLDGIVLRYAQYDYDELDKERLRSQFALLLCGTGVFMLAGLAVAAVITNAVTKTTLVFLSIGIVTRNIFTYSSYVFQITNQINKYSSLVITQRISYGIIVAVLLLLGVDRFEWFCIADLMGDVVGLVLAYIFNKGIYFGKLLPLKEAFQEFWLNIAAGIILMLANWSSAFLTSSAKMMIQWQWDDLTFGKISFAFNVSSLFLVFISAVSVVLFPSLKRLDKKQLPQLYRTIRSGVMPILFLVLLLYFPGGWILRLILPAYEPSLIYLATLLPTIIYSSLVNLLTNNYLKAYRKETQMLTVNLISIAVAVVLMGISAYVLHNLQMVLISVVIAMMVYSILSEIVVMRATGIFFVKEFFVEAVMTAAFIIIANSLCGWAAFGVYFIVVAVYLFFERKNLTQISDQAKKMLRRK